MTNVLPKRFNWHGKLEPYDFSFVVQGRPVVYLTLIHKDKGLPNYVKILKSKLEAGEGNPGNLALLDITHEKNCGVHDDGFCDCNSEIRFLGGET
jgi:hypothetical protein